MSTEKIRAEILSASAGSGKTYRLAYKYVRDVIENPAAYRNIIAVTFTNKATEEMKSRIIGQLHCLADNQKCAYLGDLCRDLKLDECEVRKRAVKAQTLILHNYSRFTILTIDTFFQRVLRAFIRELGLELDYALELDADALLGKSADILIKNIDEDPVLQKWLADFCQEQMDDDRSWDVRRELLRIGREIFKEQNKESLGRKSAKNELKRIMDAFIGRSEAAKESVRGLAKEALEVMSSAKVSHSAFRASCSKYFEKFAEDPCWQPNATVLNCADSVDAWFRKDRRDPAAESIVGELHSLLANIISIRTASVRLWNTAAAIQKNFRSFALLADLYDAASEVCREERTMLLSETKYLLSQFIVDSDTPFVYEKIGTRFDRFMIDEFQDTSLKEWKNFLPLLRNAMAQSDRPSVLLVGDIKQAIYRWRGGDRRILNRLAAVDLDESSTRTESLCDNYRSLPVIVEFNNVLIDKAVEIDNNILNAALDSAAEARCIERKFALEMHDSLRGAYADFVQNPRSRAEYDGYVDISVYGDEPPIIERIKAILDRGFKPKDIMILVRDKAKGAEIAETLLAFRHTNCEPRYSFDVMTQEALIIGSAPVAKFISAALALAIEPGNDIQRALFRRYGGKSIDTPLDDEEKAFLRSIRMLSPEEAFERIVMQFGLDSQPGHTAYLQALHERIMRFCTGRVADIGMWLERWNESECMKSLNVEQSETTIEITTIHKAKGLEKKVVIIPSCNWKLDPKSLSGSYLWSQPKGDRELQEIGRFPVSMSRSIADSLFAEDYYRELVDSHIDNINLLYVALTRPVESLHIFIPEPPKHNENPDNAGKLILESLKALGYELTEGEDGCRHISFGEFAPPCKDRNKDKKAEIEHKIIRNYATQMPDMELSLSSQRYFEDNPDAGLSPRNFGILMHRAFAEAETVDDITSAVDWMTADALVSDAEAGHLKAMVGKALANPVVRSWFECGGEQTDVRNESDIIRTNGQTHKRPDRVIISGRQAVVVDYKFGNDKRKEYTDQISEYKSLLGQMGYEPVKGYIWYVSAGDIEEV